jgi:hypothetical protein
MIEDNIYFANGKAKDIASNLHNRGQEYFDNIQTNGYLDILRDSLYLYQGTTFNAHNIEFKGEQGELVSLKVNHYANIATHILGMITSTRPVFQARSINTDVKSLIQTSLANDLLEYYMREKRLERYLKRAVEYAIILGSGFIKAEWNSTSGEVHDFNEETEVEIRQGDIEFSNLTPFDVFIDTTKDTYDEGDWVVCRTWKNKYDIIAKYPEHKEDILNCESKPEFNSINWQDNNTPETDDIAVYEFFHKRTEAVEDGVYLLYLTPDIILTKTAMPYRDLPVYRISAGDIIGTPYGNSNMFNLIQIQEAINSLYSTILTNQTAFGVQNLYLPRGADVSINSLSGGLNIIEGNSHAGKPEPMNLTHTPVEIFNFIKQLIGEMETISGLNAVARGNPAANVTAGNALALLESQAFEFISGLQQSYIFLIEDVGTGLVKMLQDFASVPRVAAIVGKTNKTEMKQFIGDDIGSINRVVVDVGNALAATTAGRVQMADNLLQMGAIKDIEQYFMVIETGRLEHVTESATSDSILVRDENEKLAQGEGEVIALSLDNHTLHINEHRSILSDTGLRQDVNLVDRVLKHIQEHITLLKETDPELLARIGQQPVQPEELPQEGMMPQGNNKKEKVEDTRGMLPQPAKPPQ